MKLGDRDRERFWIALTVRLGFGFMFLIAAVNIFFSDRDPDKSLGENAATNLNAFVDGLSKPFESTWINVKYHSETNPETGAPAKETAIGMMVISAFLYAMPFVFSVLSLLLITGLLLRPALRASAIFLVLLGLGKYLTDFRTGNTLTTLQDFLYAMFISLALFVLSKEPELEDRLP
jgi:hypothetical protein